MKYLNPLESSYHWAWKYDPYTSNWYYHQAKHAAFVKNWRKENTLTRVQ